MQILRIMYLDNRKNPIEFQGYRSKIKVRRSKFWIRRALQLLFAAKQAQLGQQLLANADVIAIFAAFHGSNRGQT